MKVSARQEVRGRARGAGVLGCWGSGRGRTKLDEGVGAARGLDLVAELGVELLEKLLEVIERQPAHSGRAKGVCYGCVLWVCAMGVVTGCRSALPRGGALALTGGSRPKVAGEGRRRRGGWGGSAQWCRSLTRVPLGVRLLRQTHVADPILVDVAATRGTAAAASVVGAALPWATGVVYPRRGRTGRPSRPTRPRLARARHSTWS